MKKKGFTLIELLAIVVILGVIAVVATPMVLNVAEQSKERAKKNSVLGYAEAVKLSYSEELINNTGKPLGELAQSSMQGEKVDCEYVKYDDQRYGTLLHTCSVNGKGDYCYFRGTAYDGDSLECDNVLIIIQNGMPTYNPPIIEQVSQTPSNTTYAQSKDIKVSYPSIKIVEENYFIKVSEIVELNGVISNCGINELPGDCTDYNGIIETNTWYKVNGDLTFTTDKNMTVEAITGYKNEFSDKTTYVEKKMDTTEPNASITSINVKTDRVAIASICSDTESGITKYEFSKDDGATWVDNGTNAGYTFTDLQQSTEYKIAVRCTNGSGISKVVNEAKATSTIIKPEIVQLSQKPSDIVKYPTYAYERVITITYNGQDIQSPEYYFKTTIDASVPSGIVVSSCGNGTIPGTCSSSNVTILAANTWYRTSSTLISITYKKNGALYAMTMDPADNSATASTYSIVNMDTTMPDVDISVGTMQTDRTTVTAICSDNISGIVKYEFSKDDGATWIDNGTDVAYTFTGLKQGTEYGFKVRCTNGSSLTNTASSKNTTTSIKAPTIVQSSQTPTDKTTYPTYATERVIKVTYYSDNIANPKYYYSLNGTEWIEVGTTTKELTFTENGRVYAKTVDAAGNTATASTYSVVNIDTTVPSVNIAVGTMQTDRTTVTAICSDNISGIVKYEYSKDNGTNWIANGNVNTYTFTGLTQGTEYGFKVRCTNGAALTSVASSKNTTTTIKAPTIVQASQKPTNISKYPTYAQERVIRVTYYSDNIANPKYYYSLNGTEWIEVNGTTKDLTFLSNGKVYAKTVDAAGNMASASTYSVVNMDTTIPNVSIAVGTMYTDRTTITATCSDDISGIVKYEFSKDDGDNWVSNGTTSNYTFTGLKQGTNYTFRVRCTNGSALTNEASSSKTTTSIVAPTIVQLSQTPNGEWAQSRIIKITYSSANITNPKYYYSLDGSKWTEVAAITQELTFTENGKVYAKTVDAAGNMASASTYSVVNVDSTAPNASIAVGTMKTDRTTVTATCSDTSGIVKYEFSKDNGATYEKAYSTSATTQTHTFTGLKQGTSYTFVVRCTNGSGMTKTASSAKTTTSIKAPTIAQASQTPTDKTTYPTYAQERVIRVTYYSDNIENPKYYYSYDGTTWTEVTGATTKDLTFTENGKVYAKTVDAAGNMASASTYSVVNIDTTAPNASIATSIKTDRATITATCSDDISGITKYEFSKDNGTTWTANGKTSTYTFTGLTQNTEYTFAVRCTNGSALTKTASSAKTTASIKAPTIAQASQTPSDKTTYPTYATERVIRVTYYSDNIANPKYYYSYDGTTWTEVTGTTKDLTFTTNGKVYAKTVDAAGNTATASTYSVVNIDTSAPSASIAVGTMQTDRTTVTATCSDDISGIVKYEFSKDNGSTWVANGTTASYTFTGLTQNTSYTFAIRCTNGAALTKTASSAKSTTGIKTPTIAQASQKPTDKTTYPTYASERVIRITYYSDNVASPKYYYSTDGSTWTEVTGATTKDLTFTANGKVYAKTTDAAGNTTNASTYTVANIDTSAPSASISVGTLMTDRATVIATCSDSESGITKYEYSKDNGTTWTANGTTKTYTFTGLTHNKSYTFAIRCTNGSGLTKTASKAASTRAVLAPTIAQASQTPSSGTYAQSRVIRITYTSINVTSPKYYYSIDGTNWTQLTSGTTKDITFTANGKVYAKTTDAAGNVASASTYSVANIDTSGPNITIGTVTIRTNNLTIPFTASDSESGIVRTTCVYGTSTSYGSTGTVSGTNCVISGLNANTTYYYKVTTTNGSGLTKDATGSKTTATPTKPTIAYTNTPSTAANGYLKTQVIKVTYSSANITSPQYFVKTTRAGTSSVAVTQSCGTGTNPGSCSTITSTTSLAANTWYKVSGNVNVTYNTAATSTGTLYAVTYDGNNLSTTATGTINKIDTTAPSLTIGTVSTSTNNITIPFTASDSESGIASTTCVYGTSTSYGSNGTISGTNCVLSGLTSNTTYYYKVTTKNGVSSPTEKTGSAKTAAITNPKITITSTPTSAANAYYKNQVAAITYTGTSITSPQYFVKTTRAATSSVGVTQSCGTSTNPGTCSSITSTTTLAANTWYKVSGNVNVTYSAAASSTATVYALAYDGKNYSGSVTGTLGKIDASAPSLTLGTVSATSSVITIPFTASDSESLIASTTCVYGTSISYGSNGTISGTNCVISGLTKGTTYYYKVTTTNGVGTATAKTGSKATVTPTNPTIAQASATIASGYTWATQRVIKITYSATNSSSPTYYFKSTVGATVASGVVTQACGTGTNPGTCSASSVTTLAANTWYRTTSTTPSITYTANGTLYAITKDGNNFSGQASYSVAQISTDVPTKPTIVGVANSASQFTVNVSAPSTVSGGIAYYEYWVYGIGAPPSAVSGTPTGTTTDGKYIHTVAATSGSATQRIYYKAVSNSGIRSELSNYVDIIMDTCAPTLSSSTGGGTLWAKSRTFTLTYNNAGPTAISEYCYYISDSPTAPTSTSEFICQSSNTFTITQPGKYIYFIAKKASGITSSIQRLYLYVNNGFASTIVANSTYINAQPNLKTSFSNTTDKAGLYSSTATNTNEVTYYFRGDVTNNYVNFAGRTWRIVRINEDGTVRIIREKYTGGSSVLISDKTTSYENMYYSNSGSSSTYPLSGYLGNWYGYEMQYSYGTDNYIATGDYFCEQARVKSSSSLTSGSASMTVYSSYTPTFKCSADGNGKGVVSGKYGLLTYDEMVFAGGYYGIGNSKGYLNDGNTYFLMSPSGFDTAPNIWGVNPYGAITTYKVNNTTMTAARPVVNLRSTVTVTGTGTASDPYVIQ